MVKDRNVSLTRDLFSMGMYYSIWTGIMSKEEKIDDAKEKGDDCKSKVFDRRGAKTQYTTRVRSWNSFHVATGIKAMCVQMHSNQ